MDMAFRFAFDKLEWRALSLFAESEPDSEANQSLGKRTCSEGVWAVRVRKQSTGCGG